MPIKDWGGRELNPPVTPGSGELDSALNGTTNAGRVGGISWEKGEDKKIKPLRSNRTQKPGSGNRRTFGAQEIWGGGPTSGSVGRARGRWEGGEGWGN